MLPSNKSQRTDMTELIITKDFSFPSNSENQFSN